MDGVAKGRPEVHVQERTIVAIPSMIRAEEALQTSQDRRKRILVLRDDENDDDNDDVTLVHAALNLEPRFTVFVVG